MNELKYWFTFLDRINEYGATLSKLTNKDVSSIVIFAKRQTQGLVVI